MLWQASTILAIGMASAAAPARAQTYDPNFPICMHVVQFETSTRTAPSIRWTNAGRRHLAARPCAASIRFTGASASRRYGMSGGTAALIELRF
jgi:hypothetical protein